MRLYSVTDSENYSLRVLEKTIHHTVGPNINIFHHKSVSQIFTALGKTHKYSLSSTFI